MNDPNRQLTLEEAEAEIAKRYGIPDAVWKPMVRQESGGRTDAVSPKGARGRWQVMPDTAKALGIDINDDLQVAEGGLRYLRDNYKLLRKYAKNEKHAWMAAVAAYHAGPGTVEKDFKRGGMGLPETSDGLITTRNHVLKIFDGIPSTAFDRSPLGNVGQAATTGQPQPIPPTAAPFSPPRQTGEMPKRMEMPVNPETGNYSTPEQMEIYDQVFPNQPAPRLSQDRIGQQLQGAAKELLQGGAEGAQQPGQTQLSGGFANDPDQTHVPQGGMRVTKDGKSYLATPQGNGQFSVMEETPETSYREYLKAVGMPDGPEAMQAFKDAQAALQRMGQGQAFPQARQFAPGVPAPGSYPQGVRRVPQQWTAAKDGKDWTDQQLGQSPAVYGVDLTGRERDPKRIALEKAWQAAAVEYGLTPEQTQAAIKEAAGQGYLTRDIKRGMTGEVNIHIPRGAIAKYLGEGGMARVRQQFDRERSEPQHFLYQQVQAENERRSQGEPPLTAPRSVAQNDPGSLESEEQAEKLLRQNISTAQGRASLHMEKVLSGGTDWLSHPAALLNPLAAFMLGSSYANLTSDTRSGETFSKAAEDREIAKLKDTYKTFNRAWQAERAYQGIGKGLADLTGVGERTAWVAEAVVRGIAQIGRAFTKGLIANTAKSATFLSQINEDYNILFSFLPDEMKPGLRNAGNAVEFLIRLGQEPINPRRGETGSPIQRAIGRMDYVAGKDPIMSQHLFRAAQEFEEAVGNDPKLQNRLLGQIADGFGSAASFIALGVLMPALTVPLKTGGTLSTFAPFLAGRTINLAPAISGPLQMAGPGHEEGVKSGLSEGWARVYGLGMGVLGAAEIVGAGGRVAAELGSPWVRKQLAEALLELAKSPVRRVAEGFVKEGAQEFAQEVFQTVAGKQLLTALKAQQNGAGVIETLRTTLNKLPRDLAETVSEEGLVAILTGGAMGGAGSLPGAVDSARWGQKARDFINQPDPPARFSGGEFTPAGPGLPPGAHGAGALTQPPGVTQREDGVYEAPAGQVQEVRQLPGEVATPEQQAAAGVNVGQQGPAGLPEAPAKRIAEPVQESVEKAATDVRAQKVLGVLNDLGEATIEDLRKKTRYAPGNVQGAVDLLYEAGLVEITPNGTVRATGATIEPGSIYDRYDEQGKVSQPAAPVVSQPPVPPPASPAVSSPTVSPETAQQLVQQPAQQTDAPTATQEQEYGPSGLPPVLEARIRRDRFYHPQYNLSDLAEEMGVSREQLRSILPDLPALTDEDIARKYNVPVETIKKLRPLGEIGYQGYMAHRVRATILDQNKLHLFSELSDIFTGGELKMVDGGHGPKPAELADALLDRIAATVNKPRSSQMTKNDWVRAFVEAGQAPSQELADEIYAISQEFDRWREIEQAFRSDPRLKELIDEITASDLLGTGVTGPLTYQDLNEMDTIDYAQQKGIEITDDLFSRAGLKIGGTAKNKKAYKGLTGHFRERIAEIGKDYETELNPAGNPIFSAKAVKRAYDRAVYQYTQPGVDAGADTGGRPTPPRGGAPGDAGARQQAGAAQGPSRRPTRSAVDTEAAVNMPRSSTVAVRSSSVSAETSSAEVTDTVAKSDTSAGKPKPVQPKLAAKKEAKTPDLPDMTPAQQAERQVYPKTNKEVRDILDTIRENASFEGKFYAMGIDERKGFMATVPAGATRGEIANAFDEWRSPSNALPKKERPADDPRDEIGDAGDDILFSASAVSGDEAQREREIEVMAANRSAIIPFTTPIVRELSKIKSGKVKRLTLEQMINRPGIKGPEKKLLESILARFDGPEMSTSDIELAVALEVTPLSVITESSAYNQYGLSTVGLPPSKGKTLVFNTPYDYGYTGHFSGEFGARDSQTPPGWIPRATRDQSGRTVWVAFDEANFPQDRAGLTEEAAAQYIGFIADDLATIEGWIASQDSGAATHTTKLNRGLFGHGRAVDMDEGKTAIYVEMQTDTLQKNSPADLLAKHYEQMDVRSSVDPAIMRAIRAYRAKTKKWRLRPHNWASQARTWEETVARQRGLVRILEETVPVVIERLKAKFGDNIMGSTWEVRQILDAEIAKDGPGALPLMPPWQGREQDYDAVGKTAEEITWMFGSIALSGWEASIPTVRENLETGLRVAEEESRSFDALRRAKARADRAAAVFIESLPLRDQLFAAYAKSARVRLLREVIRREALAGREKFRLATEWTLAAVEGFSAVARSTRPRPTASGETGDGPFGMPYDPRIDEDDIDEYTELDVGDIFTYNGEDYEVFEASGDTFEAAELADFSIASWDDYVSGEVDYVYGQAGSILDGYERSSFVSASEVADTLSNNVAYLALDAEDIIRAIEGTHKGPDRDEFLVTEALERLKRDLKETDNTDVAREIEDEIARLEKAVADFKNEVFERALDQVLGSGPFRPDSTLSLPSAIITHSGYNGQTAGQTLSNITGTPETGYQATLNTNGIITEISALTWDHLLELVAKEAADILMEQGAADDLIDWSVVEDRISDLAEQLIDNAQIEPDYSGFRESFDAQWIDDSYDVNADIRYLPSHANTVNFDQPAVYFENFRDQAAEARESTAAPEDQVEAKLNARDYRQITEDEWARMTDSAGVKTAAGTVLKKHGELLKDFKKERPDWRVWTDPASGYQYLETDLTPDDKGDILAFNKEKADIRAEANRVRSVLRDLRDTQKWGLKGLAAIATSRVVDGVLDGNAATTEIIRRAILNTYDRDVGLLYGMYVAPRSSLSVWTALKDLANAAPDIATATAIRQIAADWAAAMDRSVGDLVFAPTLPRSNSVREHTLSEEIAHRADYRARNFKVINDYSRFEGLASYDKALKEVRKNYPEVPDHVAHAEVVAKSFRTDAMDELGLTADEVAEINRAYADQLLDAGITAQAILENFRDVKTTKELADQIRRRRDRERSGLANARGPDGRFVQGTADRRTEGARDGEKAEQEDPDILRQATDRSDVNDLGFFSQLERTVADKMPAKASADQVRGIIKDTKQEERDWVDIEGFLDGRETVTRDELLDYIRANNATVEEVVKGEDNLADIEAWWGDEGGANETTPFDELTASERSEAINRYRDEVEEFEDVDGNRTTKFSAYTLPGGENYREMLLTLPAPTLSPSEQARYDELTESAFTRKLTIDELTERQRIGAKVTDREFRSSHWDEPNVLAHIRFDDRTVDGKRVLHVAEIQSDWHQAGRKKGYKNPRVENVNYATWGGRRGMSQEEIDSTWNTQDPRFLEWKANNDEAFKNAARVPDAPFKKSWHELAFKRVLRYAVENGYDAVTWDTGETNAERYDLSKQVDYLDFRKNGPNDTSVIGYKGGDAVVDSLHLSDEKLADTVGKEIAEKVLQNPDRRQKVSGDDLKVGGEGMKGFYDKMLPSFANKYTKKWGGKVESGRLSRDSRRSRIDDYYLNQDDDGTWAVGREDGSATIRSGFPTYREAEQFRDSLEATPAKVHRLDITPAMRESVMGGQPLFNAERVSRAQTETPEFKRWFGDSKVVDKEGKPLRVYHGTDSDFDFFGGDAYAGWFTDSPRYAKNYSRLEEEDGARTIPVYLSIQNPLDLSSVHINKDVIQDGDIENLAKMSGLPLGNLKDIEKVIKADYLWEITGSPEFRDLAEAEGYDGLRLTEFGYTTYAAFNPNQIKSAIGNSGAFDPDFDDILLSRPKMTDVEDVEAIKKEIDFNAKQLMSYLYDGKRDVRWPEAVVNLVRSGYLAGYSVIGTNVAWNTANLAVEEMVKAFALPVDWTRRQVAKRLDEGKTEDLLKKADKRLADAKKDLAELEKNKEVNGEAIKAQQRTIESIRAERRRIKARRGPNATKRAVAGTRPGDIIAGLFGETGFFREGLGDTSRGLTGALKGGIPAEEAKKFDFAGEDAPDQSFVRNTGVPLIDVIIEATKRISMGVDRPFKAYARTSQQRGIARAMAKDLADAGVASDWKKAAADLMMDPNDAMTDLAERYAQIVTFQNPNPITDAVDSIKASLLSNQILEKIAPKLATHAGAKIGTGAAYAAAGMVVPFVRTPSNIGLRALEYTPLGILSAAWHFHKVGNGYERMLHEIGKKQERAEQDARIKKLKDGDIADTKRTLNKLKMQYTQKKADLDEMVGLAGKNEDLVKRNKEAFKRWSEGFKAAKEKAEAEQEKMEKDLRSRWKKQDQALEEARRIEDDADDMQFSLLEWNRMASAFGRFGMGTSIGGLILAGVFYGIIDAVGRIGWDDEDRDEIKRKEEMRKAGISDFSVQIGGRRYQYDRFPFGQALGMGVNVLEQMQRPGTNNQRFRAASDKLITDIFNSNPVTDARFDQSDRWSKAGSYMKSLTPIINMKIWQEIGDVADEKSRTSFNKGFAAQFGRQMPVPGLRDALGVPETKTPFGGRQKTFGERLAYTLDPSKSMPATRSGRTLPVMPLKDPVQGSSGRPKIKW